MKIVFNATILDNKPTGLGIYCRNILSRIDKNLSDYILYTDNIKLQKVEENKDIILKTKSKNKIKSILLRNYLLKRWIDKNKINNILHYSPTQHGVTIKKIKQIITIHDLMPLYFPKGRVQQYIYYKYYLKRVIDNSEVIVTCSKNTKNDIIKEYNVNEDKIKVIYNGFDMPREEINKNESKKYIENKYGIKNYIFMMGIHYDYKNLHSVIKAFNLMKDKIDNDIVIAGGYKNSYGQKLKKLVRDNKLEARVKFLGYVSDEDKHKLYQSAKLFIYPSKYEGFGLPVLEAMGNHTIVACSNTSSLPEIVGDAAFMFNPNSLEEIQQTIYNILSLNDNEYRAYIDKGLEQAKMFSWDKCCKEIEEVIRSVKS